MLSPGDPVPSLHMRTTVNPRWALDSTAGRYVVLSFVGGTDVPGIQAYIDQLYAGGGLFDDIRACCYLVINDAGDERRAVLADRYPGIRIVWDTDLAVATAFGCVARSDAGDRRLRLATFVLDPGMRVDRTLPMENPLTHFAQVAAHLSSRPDPSSNQHGWAPVLLVPNLIEPALCRDYIAYADREGLEDSGFMQTDHASGQTVLRVDHKHKRRSDCRIEDGRLRDALQARIRRRLVPQIERAFQFKVTRMERYLIARYDADGGGWFRPHRDNTTLGTAHRRFAVSINLNADEYEGGDLRFPEFGRRTYRPPTGGAVVFSCSLLHEATPVTRGRRYCLLPFLYDDAAAQIRLENARHLSDPALAQDVIRSVLAPAGWFEPKDRNSLATDDRRSITAMTRPDNLDALLADPGKASGA